jgi:hypothetical protein
MSRALIQRDAGTEAKQQKRDYEAPEIKFAAIA